MIALYTKMVYNIIKVVYSDGKNQSQNPVLYNLSPNAKQDDS